VKFGIFSKTHHEKRISHELGLSQFVVYDALCMSIMWQNQAT